MKKIVCIFLSVLLLLPMIASFDVSAAAEDDYSELIAQRQAYFEAKYGSEDEYGDWGELYWLEHYVKGAGLTVLLYTDAAKEWTFELCEHDSESEFLDSGNSWFGDGVYWHITSPEIDAALQITVGESCLETNRFEYSSHLRKCIQYFGITKEELKEANRKMLEEPDSIRELFPFLSEFKFEDARKENGLFRFEPLADFMIEALYLEDDEAANNLLCEPYAVYVKDLDRAVTLRMFYDGDLWLSDFLAIDLTSDWMGRFLEIESYIRFNSELSTARESIISARETQLAAKETGDSAVTSVLVLALALPTLGALVVLKKKRKI